MKMRPICWYIIDVLSLYLLCLNSLHTYVCTYEHLANIEDQFNEKYVTFGYFVFCVE